MLIDLNFEGYFKFFLQAQNTYNHNFMYWLAIYLIQHQNSVVYERILRIQL